MDYQHELAEAFGAVSAAARITRKVQEHLVGAGAGTAEKADRSPVTVADWASQAVISGILHRALPDVPLVGEEEAGALRAEEHAGLRAQVVEWVRSETQRDVAEEEVLDWIDRGARGRCGERFWTLDPIDGTKGFLRGEQYAIALGLIEEGQVVLAVLACPNLSHGRARGAVLSAVRGHGARIADLDEHSSSVRLEPHEKMPLERTRFCESVESAHSDQTVAGRVAARLGITLPPYRIDSQAKYAAVATGDAQIYLRLPTRADYREKIWDHAAGSLVVTETGGTVTDMEGKALDFTRGRQLEENRGVIATSGGIHDEVLAAVQAEM